MKNTELILYRDLLADIKTRVRKAQRRAALSANAEMLFLYWDIGRLIASRRDVEGWGAGVIPRLAIDLKNELPEEKGFSHRNLKLMVQFFEEYQDVFAMGQRSVAPLQDASLSYQIGHFPQSWLPVCRALKPWRLNFLKTIQKEMQEMLGSELPPLFSDKGGNTY